MMGAALLQLVRGNPRLTARRRFAAACSGVLRAARRGAASHVPRSEVLVRWMVILSVTCIEFNCEVLPLPAVKAQDKRCMARAQEGTGNSISDLLLRGRNGEMGMLNWSPWTAHLASA